ncbi:hypothetical protein HanRHA438_Chr14g0665041 [Helianthus annuus]|nr:hypothetical protein HanRHA438_Chr14g0665041 [Helianthus annuus]
MLYMIEYFDYVMYTSLTVIAHEYSCCPNLLLKLHNKGIGTKLGLNKLILITNFRGCVFIVKIINPQLSPSPASSSIPISKCSYRSRCHHPCSCMPRVLRFF